MPKFSQKSIDQLASCHPNLQALFLDVVQIFDIAVIQGHRTFDQQVQALNSGHSKVGPEDSKHCRKPSMAVDVAPYPIDWENRERFYFLAGIVKALAYKTGVRIRWGGDWNGDGNFKDNTFDDLCHFEMAG